MRKYKIRIGKQIEFYYCSKCKRETKCIQFNRKRYDILTEKHYINKRVYCKCCGNKILEENI